MELEPGLSCSRGRLGVERVPRWLLACVGDPESARQQSLLLEPAHQLPAINQTHIGEQDVDDDGLQYRFGLSDVSGLEYVEALAAEVSRRNQSLENIVLDDEHGQRRVSAGIAMIHDRPQLPWPSNLVRHVANKLNLSLRISCSAVSGL